MSKPSRARGDTEQILPLTSQGSNINLRFWLPDETIIFCFARHRVMALGFGSPTTLTQEDICTQHRLTHEPPVKLEKNFIVIISSSPSGTVIN
jgi:hypothetical protein